MRCACCGLHGRAGGGLPYINGMWLRYSPPGDVPGGILEEQEWVCRGCCDWIVRDYGVDAQFLRQAVYYRGRGRRALLSEAGQEGTPVPGEPA